MERKGITLIGMPTSGKSTIGKALAERLQWPLLDVDRWMETQMGRPLAEIIEEDTCGALDLETACLMSANLHQVVVSTPGSVIYNGDAVRNKLQMETDVVWLDVPLQVVEHRLATDPNPNRASQIIGIKEKGIAGLYAERRPLYMSWMKYNILADGHKTVDNLVDEVVHATHALE